MNKLYLIALCFILSNCGSVPAEKPAIFWSAATEMDDAIQAYANEEWIRSQQLFNRALLLYQSFDDRRNELACHINLVEVALATHDEETASKHLNTVEAIVATDGLSAYQPRIKLLYAKLAMQRNKTLEAEALFNQILPEFEGDIAVTRFSNNQLAAISSRTELAFLQKKDQFLWTQRYANSLTIDVNNNAHSNARLLRFQAKLLLLKNDYNQAGINLQQALLLYKNKLSRTGIAGTLLELADFHYQQGHWLQASSYFDRSIHVFNSLGQTKKVNQIIEKRRLIEPKITQ